MRRLILSRKGFDSSFGGSPSPILEDGTIISFPIPADSTNMDYDIRYKDLRPLGIDIGKMIQDLAKTTSIRKDHKVIGKNRVSPDDLVHLDPDIYIDALPKRDKGWRGLFGQVAAAQGHLRNEGVGNGDIFLFYGLYRKVKLMDGRYTYVRDHKPVHLIWGWMQIADKVDLVNEMEKMKAEYPWALYHPHCRYLEQPVNNTLYVAREHLSIQGLGTKRVKGYGVFTKFDPRLQLTDPDSVKTSHWRLPAWMYKKGEPCCPLTYNGKREWRLERGYARLESYFRAQEFVFKSDDEVKPDNWLAELVSLPNA